jgi:hypothetical protein
VQSTGHIHRLLPYTVYSVPQVLESLGQEVSQAQLENMMKEVDADGSGTDFCYWPSALLVHRVRSVKEAATAPCTMFGAIPE